MTPPGDGSRTFGRLLRDGWRSMTLCVPDINVTLESLR